MNDSELGLELAEIVRKEQEEATMLHREQKDVAKTDIPKRHKIDWDALTEEEYGSGAVTKNPAVEIEKEDADNGRVMNDHMNKLQREVAKAEEILAQKKNQLAAVKRAAAQKPSPTEAERPWERFVLPASPPAPVLQPREMLREALPRARFDEGNYFSTEIQKYVIKLQNFETAAGWAVAYHGTKYKFLGSILNEGLKNSKADHRDAGVYVTPVFETALGYADEEEKSHF